MKIILSGSQKYIYNISRKTQVPKSYLISEPVQSLHWDFCKKKSKEDELLKFPIFLKRWFQRSPEVAVSLLMSTLRWSEILRYSSNEMGHFQARTW